MLKAGDQIDVWVVEKQLGSGGMGSVYRCHNRNAARISAAVKVLDANLRAFPEAEARFIREAEILFRLDHPNIVKVRNVRTDNDPCFLEMEFIEGESLEDRLQKGAMSVDDALPMMVQLASSVAYLHALGIRHRDIKPANILVLKDGRIKLVDFGLAMEADATRLTQTGLSFGTVSYAPPEWLAPETLDAAKWDIYAMGVVFYEMLTGGVAFPVSGVGSARQQAAQVIFSKQNHRELDPGPGVPEELRKLIVAASHSDLERRIPTAAELLDRLRRLAPDVPVPAPSLGPLPPPPPSLPGLKDREPTGETILIEAPLSASPRARTGETPVRTGASLAPPGVWMGLAGLGAGATVLLGAGLVLGIGTWWLRGGQPATRPVTAIVVGAPAGTPVSVRVDGALADGVSGFEHNFSVTPGSHAVRFAVGDGCAECPGTACPAWCGLGTQTVDVPAGVGPWRIEIPVPVTPSRELRLPLPALPEGTPATVTLGDRLATIGEGMARLANVTPGAFPLAIDLGSCPVEAAGCWPDRDCPAGCVSYRSQAVVPWGEGPWQPDLGPKPLPVPATAAPIPVAAAEPRAVEPAPVAAPASAPEPASSAEGRAGGLVTVGQFSRWLAEHPDVLEEAAAPGDGLLDDWTGAEPPAGAGKGDPVTGVNWSVASRFCAAKGGLATAQQTPTTWGGAPGMEWRLGTDGAAVFLTSDGQAGATGKRKPSRSAGFRCAR